MVKKGTKPKIALVPLPPRADLISHCPPHHMLYETPNGPRVRGTCRKCGHEEILPTTLRSLDYVGLLAG